VKIEAEKRKAKRRARLEAEDRKAERQAKLEMEKSILEFDLSALEINDRSRPATDSQSTFRVETAAKLFPKLASEQELEVHLIICSKIASLDNSCFC